MVRKRSPNRNLGLAFARHIGNVHHDGISIEFDRTLTLVNCDAVHLHNQPGVLWNPLVVTATRTIGAATGVRCADGQWSFVEAAK
jgi:hypothetical protein